jgi:hypothetical protein
MNAKMELIEALEGRPDVRCAKIEYNNASYILKEGYTKKEFSDFLKEIDFDYDEEEEDLYGNVWFIDGKVLWHAILPFPDAGWYIDGIAIPQECKR